MITQKALEKEIDKLESGLKASFESSDHDLSVYSINTKYEVFLSQFDVMKIVCDFVSKQSKNTGENKK